MPTALVTGGTGFVGRHLSARLIADGWKVRVAVRHGSRLDQLSVGAESVWAGPLGADTEWAEALESADVVFHLAARVHVMRQQSDDESTAFAEANAEGTRRLAECALRAGVKRFVFVSTVKVHGESTLPGVPFRESDILRPTGGYAISKLLAERYLRELGARGEMGICVLRPPLVYGPGAGANFARLVRLARLPVPLPLGGLSNLRSMIYVGNLVDALIVCAQHEGAGGRTFLISDGEDLTPGELVAQMRAQLGRQPGLLPFPRRITEAAFRLVGRGEDANRLFRGLQVDGSLIREHLGWRPPYTLDDGLRLTMGGQ